MNMSPIVIWAVVLQVVIPLVVILTLPLGPQRSRVTWISQLCFAALLIVAVALSGLWLAVPWYLPWAMMALLVIAAFVGRDRMGGRWPTSRGGWILCAGTAGMALLLGAVSGQALLGRRPPPGPPVVLSFPLEGGPFLVASGGSNSLVNPHLATLAPDFAPYRGQSYAVDLVGIGRWGSRRRGFAPTDPAEYAIFGTAVLSPCDGVVLRSFDGVSDNPVPVRSRNPIEGNHVVMECGGRWILLAHLRSGSVTVEVGDAVTIGTPIGQVGNSGQSDEPHLHIHAQTSGTDLEPISGEPLPLRFEGLPWPVRNQRITVPAGRSSTR